MPSLPAHPGAPMPIVRSPSPPMSDPGRRLSRNPVPFPQATVTPEMNEPERSRSSGRAAATRPGRRRSGDDSGPSLAEDSEVLREALDLAALGLPVIPLGPRSKVPRIRRWREEGTTDTRVIHNWFAGRPEDNLGLLTGDGLVALDLDVGAGGLESCRRLIEERGGLPETAMAETGSGGRHLLLRVEGRFANRVGLLPGVDLRGDGGQIVVAPSVHPQTGGQYTWVRHPRDGIAEAPEWFIRWLAETGDAGRPPRKSRAPSPTIAPIARPPVPDTENQSVLAGEMPGPIVLDRVGDRATLAAAMIARFPVAGPGHRHKGMTRAVGHLLGAGYGPGLVAAVLVDWHAHFHDSGAARTVPDEAAREVDACIRSTVRGLERGTFRPSTSDLDREDSCRGIQLDAGQRELLSSRVVVIGIGGEKTLLTGPASERRMPLPAHATNCKRVTQTGRFLCESGDERAFVEALLVQATYKIHHAREYSDDGVIRATHDQLGRIAGARHGGLRWAPQQIERLKRKYVTREGDGKPASRFELLREVRKGERRRGHPKGRPSEYRPTGILLLLAVSVIPKRVDAGGVETGGGEEPAETHWWRDPRFAFGRVSKLGAR